MTEKVHITLHLEDRNVKTHNGSTVSGQPSVLTGVLRDEEKESNKEK